jgi:hypothetical protein
MLKIRSAATHRDKGDRPEGQKNSLPGQSQPAGPMSFFWFKLAL